MKSNYFPLPAYLHVPPKKAKMVILFTGVFIGGCQLYVFEVRNLILNTDKL